MLPRFCQHLLRFYFHVYCCGSPSDHLSGSCFELLHLIMFIPTIKFGNFQLLLNHYSCFFFFFCLSGFHCGGLLDVIPMNPLDLLLLDNICRYNNFHHFAFKFAEVTCSCLVWASSTSILCQLWYVSAPKFLLITFRISFLSIYFYFSQ